MCGIGGLTGALAARAGSDDALHAMMRSMAHRGPDGTGTFVSPEHDFAFGHNRLSIIDLSDAGAQPMIDTESGAVLVFNGEIYNFQSLRLELEAQGCRFRSRCDSEVLLQALVVWGRAALERLAGMFAFVFWQPRTGRLLMARDPLGMKPLYYWPSPEGGLAFASEIKALFHTPGFVARPDRRALGQYLEFGYTFDAERTILDGLKKLPPGHFIDFAPSKEPPAPEAYYRPELAPGREAGEPHVDAEQELYETLQTVVEEHLVADVPVGLLLSGGLDSSLLAAMAARTAPVRTFSMGFADSALDERSEARRVAEHIGSTHEEILISASDVRSGLDDTVAVFDDLFADWGTVSTRLLYKASRERGLKVVIVGEGSDELFGGYDVFRKSFSNSPTEWWIFQLYRLYIGRRHGRYYRSFRRVIREYLKEAQEDRFGAIRLFESRRQLPNNYVMKVDKASMSASVEARAPFLDRRIADIAYRTPVASLTTGTNEKMLLRRVAERYELLPKETWSRRKLGGSIAASWMDTHAEWRDYAREVILGGNGWTRELGLEPAMRAYFEDGKAGYRFPHSISVFRNLAWRLLLLELWSRSYRLAPHVA